MSMDCRRFKREQIAVDLGLEQASADLRGHEQACRDCRDWVKREQLIADSLREIRRAPAPDVNVVARVSQEIRTADARPARAARWSLVALPLATLAMLIGLWNSGIRAQPLLESAVRALLFGRQLAENLWTPLATLLRAAGRLVLTLLTALADALDSLGSLEPWFVGTAALCTLMMATSVLLVVGRDIGRHRVEREDNHR